MAALAGCLAPGLWLGWALAAGALGATPWKAATNETGSWALYLLLATLAVSPLRGLLAWPGLTGIRRMLGLAAFAYAAMHLAVYAMDQGGDLLRVAAEIIGRTYLAIGFCALLGLALLAATSFDAALRRLGRQWRRLHRTAYLLAGLALLHHFLQSRVDVSGPVMLAGVYFGLMLYRLPMLGSGVAGVVVRATLAALVAAGLEFAWYAGSSGIQAGLVLRANLDVSARVAPMWQVLAVCLAPLPAMLVRVLAVRYRPAIP